MQADECNEGQHYESDSIHVTAAKFILGLKEKFKLTQAATTAIIEGFTNLLQVINKRFTVKRNQLLMLIDLVTKNSSPANVYK